MTSTVTDVSPSADALSAVVTDLITLPRPRWVKPICST